MGTKMRMRMRTCRTRK